MSDPTSSLQRPADLAEGLLVVKGDVLIVNNYRQLGGDALLQLTEAKPLPETGAEPEWWREMGLNFRAWPVLCAIVNVMNLAKQSERNPKKLVWRVPAQNLGRTSAWEDISQRQ